MEFANLSPFHSMAFQSLDLAGNACTTVVTKVGYRITLNPASGIGELALIEDDALPLTLSDEYWDEEPANTRIESDLAPFKPLCDLLVIGKTYAPDAQPTPQWPLRIKATQRLDRSGTNDTEIPTDAIQTLMDKTLYVGSPGHFQKTFLGWKYVRETNATEMPLRWDYAFGGSSQITNPKHAIDPSQPEWLLNEACFSNPIGRGWIEHRHNKFARKAGLPQRDAIPAPCFFYPNEAIAEPVLVSHPKTAPTRQDMVNIASHYSCRPAGLGPVGRSWVPRIAFTGTYDQSWQERRWPLAPLDFDERYWNCAPSDQQFPWPLPDCRIETWFLFPAESTSNGYAQLQLPGHRAFVMARLQDDTPIPLTTHIDTLVLDTEKHQLEVTWRCRINNSAAIRMLETRFEIDPLQPLLKYQATSQQPDATTPKAA